MRSQAVELSRVFSKSLASRRLRLSQASAHSATQRCGSSTGVGSPDDLDRPVAVALERCPEFVAGTAAVSEDMTQPREAGADRGQDFTRAVAVLDVGRMDPRRHQQPTGIGQDVTLPASASLIWPKPFRFRLACRERRMVRRALR